MRLVNNISRHFWRKVEKRGENECWEWTGARSSKGYGSIALQLVLDGKACGAHRLAWILTFGPIPKGLSVLHKCDNPPCCNPRHLVLGTAADNAADMATKGRAYRPVGEKNPAAKLTSEQVAEIRRSWLSAPKLAVQLGVKKWTIYSIRWGETWKEGSAL